MEHEPKVIIQSDRPTRKRTGTQDVIPAEAVTSPTEVTREGASSILKAVFDSTQETAGLDTTTNVSTGTVEGSLDLPNETTSEFNSTQLREWARYFNDFPISLQSPMGSAEGLIRYLDYGLRKTKFQLPQIIQDNLKALKQISLKYDETLTDLVRNAPATISTFKQEFLDNPRYVQLCTSLLQSLKKFGCELYTQLAELSEKEEQQTFLHSKQGEHVQNNYPALARAYEIAPDQLETSKQEYKKELRAFIEAQVNKGNGKTENDPKLANQFSLTRIADLIFQKTFNAIEAAIENTGLSDEGKAAIFSNLPAGIVSSQETAENGNIHALFYIDKPTPENSPYEFLQSITKTLLKARTLTLASHGEEEETRQILWYYAHLVSGGRVDRAAENYPAIHLGYSPNGFIFDKESFFSPISADDQDFFGDVLVLTQRNEHLSLLKKELQLGIQKQQSNEKTIVAYGLAADVQGTFIKNLAFLTSQEQTEEPTNNSIQIGSTREAVKELEALRALIVTLLFHKDNTIVESNKRIDGQRAANFKRLGEAGQETHEVQEKLRETEEQLKIERANMKTRLLALKEKTGILTKGLASDIDAILSDLEDQEDENTAQ